MIAFRTYPEVARVCGMIASSDLIFRDAHIVTWIKHKDADTLTLVCSDREIDVAKVSIQSKDFRAVP